MRTCTIFYVHMAVDVPARACHGTSSRSSLVALVVLLLVPVLVRCCCFSESEYYYTLNLVMSSRLRVISVPVTTSNVKLTEFKSVITQSQFFLRLGPHLSYRQLPSRLRKANLFSTSHVFYSSSPTTTSSETVSLLVISTYS
jgi:hypothetical protein